MKLEKKRALVARTLGVGKGRVRFNTQQLSSVKEAITKQDIKDLVDAGAIMVLPVKGRKAVQKRTTRRRAGSVKKKVKGGKREYITITRKLRSYLAHLKSQDKISQEQYETLRKEIRMRSFRSLAHMKERIAETQQ